MLVQAGPDGIAADLVAEKLALAPNTLTFHFNRLKGAGLATVRRDGRSMIYTARYETTNSLIAFLTENCCQGTPCAPVAVCNRAPEARQGLSSGALPDEAISRTRLR